MMMERNVKKLLGVIGITLALTACSKGSENLYDPNAISEATETNVKADYQKAFKTKYANVDLNQNWDLSCQSSAFSLPVSGAQARTRSADSYSVEKKVYELDTNILKWLKTELPSQDNRSKGKPFYMKVPSSNFSIIPVFQNRANGIWDLHMVVDGTDILVWKKSEDMYIKSEKYKEWTALLDIPEDVQNGVKKDNTRTTWDATEVKAPELYFSNMPAGKDIYFYLEITATTSKVHDVGDKLSSLEGNMLSLTLPEGMSVSNIDASKQISFIAVEDGKAANNCDWSLNDVVFMVVGDPDVPQTTILTDGTPIEEKRTVRYMIEDLGATDDFDFNDIVVDVEQTRTTTPIITTITDKNGKQIEWLSGWKNTAYTQKAIIRHLGGTLPFKIKVGNTMIEDVDPHMNSNPDTEYTVSGWNPDTHNIVVSVKQNSSSSVNYNTIPFPKAGEAPMIIAVNDNVQWMSERQSIPESWFIDNRTDD